MEPRTNDVSAIDRLYSLFKKSDSHSYDALQSQSLGPDQNTYISPADMSFEDPLRDEEDVKDEGEPFSWFEYSIFLLLGIAMLWAWNMFLAAAPYFQTRFADNKSILESFQSAIISVACVANLGSMLILGQLQAKASYPRRILLALAINVVVFTLLSISATTFRTVSSPVYLAFTLLMVFATSCATGLCQNGAFAFASSFGRPEYIQAIMTGQAVAGVLPSVAQILSVLAIPAPSSSATTAEKEGAANKENNTSAFVYFLTATIVSLITLLAVVPLLRKHNRILENKMIGSIASVQEAEQAKRTSVSIWTLYKKLRWLAAGVFVCFAVTMFFPVFTQKIVSVVPEDKAPRLFRPSAFIPLGFLVWNLGDLCGRLVTLLPACRGGRLQPPVLFIIAILRAGFIPLYLLCNISGKGAVISNDAFYLFVVQYCFGLSNGWLSSLCMMGAGGYVDDSEREAAGGFMAINLVAGLTAGSLLSFAVK